MNPKTTLVLIALIGAGLFALPQTTALFAGQHGFVNIDPTGNQIECIKCHGDIQSELQSEHNTLTGTDGPHAAMKCEYCHRLQIGQSSGDSAYALVEYGAAVPKATDPANVTYVRRWIVIKAADYEARLYPTDFAANATTTKLGTGATAGVSVISPLYIDGVDLTQEMYDTPGLKFKWNYSEPSTRAPYAMTPRSRQTDIIDNGVGVVTWMARGTILPLYNDSKPIDTNDTTKDTAFNPAQVTWNTSLYNATSGMYEPITKPTTQPAVVLDGAGSRTVNAGSRYHAASLVACMDCHAGSSPQPGHETARLGQTNPTDEIFCENCHYGTEEPGSIRTYELSAGGFGGITNNAPDTGVAEVHNKFVKTQADNLAVGVFGGRVIPANNAACIACHTHVDVEITFTRPTTLVFSATEDGNGNWSETGYSATGTNTTTG